MTSSQRPSWDSPAFVQFRVKKYTELDPQNIDLHMTDMIQSRQKHGATYLCLIPVGAVIIW